jgi:hypothetical protein
VCIAVTETSRMSLKLNWHGTDTSRLCVNRPLTWTWTSFFVHVQNA